MIRTINNQWFEQIVLDRLWRQATLYTLFNRN
jgi:hypothetical protein